MYLMQRIITPRASLQAAITLETTYHGQNQPYRNIMANSSRKRSIHRKQSNSIELGISGEQSNSHDTGTKLKSIHDTETKETKLKSVLFSISLCACAIIACVIYGLKDMVEDLREMTYTRFGGTLVERVSIYPYPFHAECLTMMRSDHPSSYSSLCRPGSGNSGRQLGRRAILAWFFGWGLFKFLQDRVSWVRFSRFYIPLNITLCLSLFSKG